MSKEYRDPDWLHEKYAEEGLTQYEIADMCGVEQSTIQRWMDRHGVESKSKKPCEREDWLKEPVRFETYGRGYERWHHRFRNKRTVVRVHRLLAVAEYGFDAVDPEMDIHHKNGIPWDNRPENIELLEHSEHSSLHRAEVA